MCMEKYASISFRVDHGLYQAEKNCTMSSDSSGNFWILKEGVGVVEI